MPRRAFRILSEVVAPAAQPPLSAMPGTASWPVVSLRLQLRHGMSVVDPQQCPRCAVRSGAGVLETSILKLLCDTRLVKSLARPATFMRQTADG